MECNKLKLHFIFEMILKYHDWITRNGDVKQWIAIKWILPSEGVSSGKVYLKLSYPVEIFQNVQAIIPDFKVKLVQSTKGLDDVED